MADEKNWWQPLSDFADLLSQPLFPNPANAFAPAPEPLFTGSRTGAELHAAYNAQQRTAGGAAAAPADVSPIAQASQAVNAFAGFLNQPLFPHPANAFRPEPTRTGLPAAASRQPPSKPASSPWSRSARPVSNWFMQTPGMVYATATVDQLKAPPPAQPGAPASTWWGDLGANFQATMAVVGGVTEVNYNTPLPFINLTVAEIIGPALDTARPEPQRAIRRPGSLPHRRQRRSHRPRHRRSRVDGRPPPPRPPPTWGGATSSTATPTIWGMDPAQAAEFAMARRDGDGFQ